MLKLLDAIADFADVEALEYGIFRDVEEDERGKTSEHWVCRFVKRDQHGEYSVNWNIPPNGSRYLGEEGVANLRKKMDGLFVKAKIERNRKMIRLAA